MRSVRKTYLKESSYILKLLLTIALICALTVPLPGCTNSGQLPPVNTSSRDNDYTVESPRPVQEIADELFAYMVSTDFTLYNQLIANPDDFDIAKPQVDFGEISKEADDEGNEYYRMLLRELRAYTDKDLSAADRRLCDYMVYYLDTTLDLEPYYYYWDPYMPSQGIHINVPLCLMTFSFRTTQDIDDYLTLVQDIPRILGQADEFLNERTSRGIISNSASFDSAIEEAEVYIADVDHNLLVITFEERLNSGEGPFAKLSKEEREEYAARNRTLVETQVIPAYEQTIRLLESVATQASSTATIASLPNAKEYYAASMRELGFDTTPEEAIALIDEYMDIYWDVVLGDLNALDYDEFDRISARNLPEGATAIISYFSEAMHADFPDIGTRSFVVNAASDDEVMKNILAFYLLAPVDDLSDNRIVYYPQNLDSLFDLADTLAHESFPGHLYQYNYFGLTSPHPLELLLSFTAYMEGYAVYSQSFAYQYIGLSEKGARVANAYTVLMRLLQARLDLGINYEGWTLAQTKTFLESWGMSGYAEEIFQDTASTPIIILPYGLGPLKIYMLRERAQTELGSRFVLKEFHEVILRNGGVPFWLLEENCDKWLAEKR